MLHFELYATTQWPRPPLSIGGRWQRRAPESYAAAEQVAIRSQGWHWNFQRRLDLADPTDFLLALRDGQIPPQPMAYSHTDQPVHTLEAIRVTPSEAFLREQAQHRVQQAQWQAMEEYYRWLEQQGRMPFRRRFRSPGPQGLRTMDDTRRVACEYIVERPVDDRHGPH
jgi:hypothetical protein